MTPPVIPCCDVTLSIDTNSLQPEFHDVILRDQSGKRRLVIPKYSDDGAEAIAFAERIIKALAGDFLEQTPNGYDARWIGAINGALADRAIDNPVHVRAVDLNDDLWDEFIGPLVDLYEDEEVSAALIQQDPRDLG